MDEDSKSSMLKEIIDPEHLLQAIANSLEHSDETAHGITGLHFKNYTITVQKMKSLAWFVELKFKTEGTDVSLQPVRSSRLRCRTRLKKP
jgi:hypothetical protein